ICPGSSLSLTCETAREYRVRADPLNIPANSRKTACGRSNMTMLPATIVAIVQAIAITVRRSMRAANLPIGDRGSTAERMLTAMKVATPEVPSPLLLAYTGPMPNMVDETMPETVTATTPNGEFRYRSRYRTLTGVAATTGV